MQRIEHFTGVKRSPLPCIVYNMGYMTEAPRSANARESSFLPKWKVTNQAEVTKMIDAAHKMGVVMYDDLPIYRGGGILEPADAAAGKTNREAYANSKSAAVVLGRTKGSSEPNVVIHYPTNTEWQRYDATFFAYQAYLGDYLRETWNAQTRGLNPLPGILGSIRLDDGRFVTAIRFRKNFVRLGHEGQAKGVHMLDTSRITPGELRHVVRTLDAIHVDADEFRTWAKETNADIPKESTLNTENPGYAFRGKEWWISPDGESDRMTELTKKAKAYEEIYRSVDPSFDPAEGIASMIRNNIELYPHTDGRIDHPELTGDMVVVHGALYPDNIHIRRENNGKLNITVTGGDRAQGMGLRGQMIDWMITAAAESPKHQNALISEYIKLHPSDKDRRALAMHVMYRSVLEIPWFINRGYMDQARNLATLVHSITTGKGVWAGVQTPLTA